MNKFHLVALGAMTGYCVAAFMVLFCFYWMKRVGKEVQELQDELLRLQETIITIYADPAHTQVLVRASVRSLVRKVYFDESMAGGDPLVRWLKGHIEVEKDLFVKVPMDYTRGRLSAFRAIMLKLQGRIDG